MPRKVTEDIPVVPADEIPVDHAALGDPRKVVVVPEPTMRTERGLPPAHTLASVPSRDEPVMLGLLEGEPVSDES